MRRNEKLVRLYEIVAALEAVKPLYEEYDRLVQSLRRPRQGTLHYHGQRVPFEVVDNFEGKNSVWRAHAVRRYQIQFGYKNNGRGKSSRQVKRNP